MTEETLIAKFKALGEDPRVARALAVATSWWFIGAVGWIIVISQYPVDTVLPRYAG